MFMRKFISTYRQITYFRQVYLRLDPCCGRWGWHMSALCQLHLPQHWSNLRLIGPNYELLRYSQLYLSNSCWSQRCHLLLLQGRLRRLAWRNSSNSFSPLTLCNHSHWKSCLIFPKLSGRGSGRRRCARLLCWWMASSEELCLLCHVKENCQFVSSCLMGQGSLRVISYVKSAKSSWPVLTFFG